MTRRNYTDHEIACYVLGLETSIPAHDIEDALAHDNAAAARALKWETYFLCIVDALPVQAPAHTLLPQIEQSLGISTRSQDDPAVASDTPDTPMDGVVLEPSDRARQTAADLPVTTPGTGRRWWQRWPVLATAAVIVVLLLFLLWGVTRDVPSTEISQPLMQQPANQSPATHP